MKKSKKILIVVLVLIILSGASIGVGIYLNKKGKNVTVRRMSTVSQEKTFGNITVTVLPEIIGTWYESSTYNSEGENNHILTISEIYQGSIIGTVCLKSHEYYTDFKTTKIEEGIYKIESNEFCVTLEGTLEVTEKAINLKIDKVANDATSDVKALEGKTIKFDYEDQKIFEGIFSTTAGTISISSGPYEGINRDDQYSILKSEIIELLNECVTSTYTVDGRSFSTPKECGLLLNMGEHNIITIDTRDIFIPCDENDPIVITEMIRDQIYYHIVDTTEHKDVREALNNIVNTSVKLIEEEYYN